LLAGGIVSAAAQRATRLWPGHPEGFLEAFANLYAGAADAVLARRDDAPLDRLALSFPTVEDGVLGVSCPSRRRVESPGWSWVEATVDLRALKEV